MARPLPPSTVSETDRRFEGDTLLSPEGKRQPRVQLVALGCRVNRAERDALAASLKGRFDLAREGEAADYVVVHTCAITCDADSASRQAIRRAARDHPGARIVAAGCTAELSPDTLASLPGVVTVLGTRGQTAIPELLSLLDEGEEGMAAQKQALTRAPAWAPAFSSLGGRARPTFKIQDGCDARCSYCVVPAARGVSRSMPLAEAFSNLQILGRGHAEVVLSGIHLGAYGRDLDPPSDLAKLVRGAAARQLVRRLRLSSIEPLEFPVELLAEPESRALLCEHFHVPLQSGSSRVLEAMRRPYLASSYAELIRRIASLVPGSCLGADVMAGFPGETDQDHRETMELLESIPLSYLHVFPWSPRPGTEAAARADRVPAVQVRERTRELREFSRRRWREYLAAQVGREVEVVVERIAGGWARGTTRQYVRVTWPATEERRGELVPVQIREWSGERCTGVRLQVQE